MAQSGSALFAVALGTFVLIVLLPHKEAQQAAEARPFQQSSDTPGTTATPLTSSPVPTPLSNPVPGPSPSGQMVNAADGYVSIQRAADSHFYADAEVNGTTVHFLIDTGATGVVLTAADAQRVGVSGEGYTLTAKTAGGDVPLMPATASRVALGSFAASDVPVLVAKDQLGISLLGQSYLSRIGTVSITGDVMTLR
jgi:aspartyl protease family protein